MRWAALYRRPPILRGVSASQIRGDHAVNQARINARYGPALPSSPQLRGETGRQSGEKLSLIRPLTQAAQSAAELQSGAFQRPLFASVCTCRIRNVGVALRL